MVLDGLSSGVGGIAQDVKTFISEKPVTSAGIGVGVLGVSTLGVIKATKRKKKKTRTKRGRSRDRKFISKQKHEVKRKRKRPAKIYKKKGVYTSRRPLKRAGKKTKKRVGKVYYTKRGQPYKILSSGKARFIKGKRRKR